MKKYLLGMIALTATSAMAGQPAFSKCEYEVFGEGPIMRLKVSELSVDLGLQRTSGDLQGCPRQLLYGIVGTSSRAILSLNAVSTTSKNENACEYSNLVTDLNFETLVCIRK